MTEAVDIINFAIAVSGLVVATIGFLTSIVSTYMEKRERVFFTAFFLLLFFYVGADLLSQVSLILLGPDFSLLSRIAVFLESFFSSMLMPLFTVYMLSCASVKWKRSPWFYSGLCAWAVYFTLLLSTFVSSHIYYITVDNIYHRGPLYHILLIPSVLLMLMDLGILLTHYKSLIPRKARAFTLYIIIPLVGMLIQMFSFGLLMIVISTCIAAFFMLILIMTGQIKSYISKQKENALAYAENLALQMRPHFIYNVMMSIYYLIEQNPDKARQVTLDFTTYLRKNFSSVASENMIPFTEELEHVKAYLSVEQVRFEEILYVDIDTPHTGFKLPPLTIQPIVENAVRHGVDPEHAPLHISIRTESIPAGSVVTIENDGLPLGENDSDDPHIALNNIRERLKNSCNGRIDVTGMDGKGARVTIFIPAAP